MAVRRTGPWRQLGVIRREDELALSLALMLQQPGETILYLVGNMVVLALADEEQVSNL